MSTSRGANPPNYQESVKAHEFLTLVRQHGIITEDCSSRQASSTDSAKVKEQLHYGVKLLISNSKGKIRTQAREDFGKLLVEQAAYFYSGMLEDIEGHRSKIHDFLLQDEMIYASQRHPPVENMEVDMYSHGWVEGPLVPVEESHSEIMGIRTDVIPMHMGTPEARPTMSVGRPQKMTPSANKDSNVINVGEAGGTSNDILPKKVAQLERALTYARYRANKEDIAEVVGYGALGMSMVDGASIASAMISLNGDIFPLLASMQRKGGLAYLLSSRSVFDDVQKAMESHGALEDRLKGLEERLEDGLDDVQKAMKKLYMIVLLGFGCLSIGHFVLRVLRR